MSELSVLRLKKNEERRLRAGHLWVFSNEVDGEKTPLKRFAPGEYVIVEDSRQQPLGLAYVNPESLICARLLSRDHRVAIDHAFLLKRLSRALHLREMLFAKPYYRLVYGESDGLPGLVIDRLGDVLVLQASTLGAERLQEQVMDVLDKLLSPRTLVLKNTSSLRQFEKLENYVRVLGAPLEGPIPIEENGARFLVDPVEGQKTGWFFDHRLNRAVAAQLSKCQRVLDLFSYTGGWGVQAALGGAESVDCVDSSESALALAAENARLNGVADRMGFIRQDVFEFLKQLRHKRQRYDLIVADPPALIKRKKDVKAGVEAYHRLNQAAMQVLNPGGVLVSASCSFNLPRSTLHDILRTSSRHLDRHLVILGQGCQGPDHPVHPAIPETEYLKTFFCHLSMPL
ncbi:class I SAM-dependent rRNA methyltransferase [Methylococcus capsulatus]|jgi:23S rRNA (cytosine1962-C5)-methyltransferase|uniref:23S rRNA (Cytosine1962-C5)-methyltransferase n=1 Tax=Methylococcus capsulatus TaxID=414 RepID=A0AA35UN99_METCP|nr:class I SAM-dependent rRNA methyltransferase [Methylococcus capsulatus]QXP88212.1 class I SAM-dependent rRNA methyltransferase [Methylococcus capsulatus]QXP94778.1 class I SAM-dependent rRNA methyltransferase [Methylococcus capsulatus]UQN13248.1 class I SAM-dependent rRNA methyltransferase [Methylococcus capsulatus]CAI8729423.1 23S rRNA (cytosine1962-C5)-methyltransferase [Methylococcus capsulatus]